MEANLSESRVWVWGAALVVRYVGPSGPGALLLVVSPPFFADVSRSGRISYLSRSPILLSTERGT